MIVTIIKAIFLSKPSLAKLTGGTLLLGALSNYRLCLSSISYKYLSVSNIILL